MPTINGPSLAADIKEAVTAFRGDVIAGPIDSTNGFKINGTNITSVIDTRADARIAADETVVAKAGDTGTVVAGSVTAQAADDTAGSLDIVTGLSTVSAFVIQILRAGVPIVSDQVYSESGGTLTVADGAATYDVTADDVINWIAIGAL